jgi:hypothetical protein
MHPSVIATPLSTTNPVALGTASPGTGTTASKTDHVHPTTGLLPDAASPSLPSAWAATASAGTSQYGSRADHVHPASLASTATTALGSSTIGTSTSASRADHIHPSTGIQGHVTPSANALYDLGASGSYWNNAYVNTYLYMGSGARVVSSGGALIFQTNSTSRMTLDYSTGFLLPMSDNAYRCGSSANRWTSVWAVNGTIQTSDAEEKEEIADSALGLDFINALRPVSYRWKVGGKILTPAKNPEEPEIPVDRPGVRRHYGLLAQDVFSALDGKDFGGYVHDPETNFYGLRYSEFIAPLIKAVQELTQRIAVLEDALSQKTKGAPGDAANH